MEDITILCGNCNREIIVRGYPHGFGGVKIYCECGEVFTVTF